MTFLDKMESNLSKNGGIIPMTHILFNYTTAEILLIGWNEKKKWWRKRGGGGGGQKPNDD